MDEKIVSVEVMRESDAWTIAHRVPSKELMYRAGEGIFQACVWKAPVGIVCGKGNNAGDGYVVAELLRRENIDCEIILVSESFSEDGRFYFERAVKAGVPWHIYQREEAFSNYGSLLDCLFGTGFSGPVKSPYREVIEAMNRSGAYIVSADINSGLNGDSGLGETYVCSDLTVSVGAFKTGHFAGLADVAMKKKVNIDIGIVWPEEWPKLAETPTRVV